MGTNLFVACRNGVCVRATYVLYLRCGSVLSLEMDHIMCRQTEEQRAAGIDRRKAERKKARAEKKAQAKRQGRKHLWVNDQTIACRKNWTNFVQKSEDSLTGGIFSYFCQHYVRRLRSVFFYICVSRIIVR